MVIFKRAPTGIELIIKEIELGDSDVLAMWGNMQFAGDGIPKNEQEGFNNIRKAAEAGDSYAQYLMGYSYDYGRGAEVDFSKAAYWYQL